MNKITKYILPLFVLLSFSFAQEECGEPNWQEEYQTVPFDNEYSATLATVQVWINGVEQTGGQLAAFGEDGEISAWDGDGATFFPPGGTNVYE